MVERGQSGGRAEPADEVRRSALNRIGEHTIRTGAPMATIEEPLVPIYMYHRYAVESTASMIGGMDYIYGDARRWPDAGQMGNGGESTEGARCACEYAEALGADDAEAGAGRHPAAAAGFGRHRELFPRTTGDGFDPLSPATVAADVTIGFTLELDRAARVVAQHAVDPTLPGLEEVIDRLTKATFDAPAATGYEQEIRRSEKRVLVDRVMWVATAAPNAQVRAVAAFKLSKLAARMRAKLPRARATRRNTCCWLPISNGFSSGPPRPCGSCRRRMRLLEPLSGTPVWTGWRPLRCAPGTPRIPTRGCGCRRCKVARPAFQRAVRIARTATGGRLGAENLIS